MEVDRGDLDLFERIKALTDQDVTHVRDGQWAKAFADYSKAIELDPSDHFPWFQSAALALELGDGEGYRCICREMLTRFGNTDKPHIAERTAKTCSLAPEAVSDFAAVLKLADRAVTGTEKHPYYRWFVLVKGLAEYRADHDAAAVDWMKRFAPQAGGCSWDATAFAVQAMAKHRLGSAPGADAARLAAEALASLGHAQAILAENMPDPAKGRPYESHNFHDWLHAQILCREAEKLIGKDEPGPMKQD